MIKQFPKDQLNRLQPMFENHRYDTVLIQSILKGYTGVASTDDLNHPTTVRLDTGAFTMFGGDPKSEAVLDLVQEKPIYFTTPENKAWEKVLTQENTIPCEHLFFAEWLCQDLSLSNLDKIIERLPKGYLIEPLNPSLCDQLPTALDNDYFFENFNSVEDFLSRGIGFCVLYRDTIVAAATSMAAANRMIDVEIETVESHRNKGLGAAVGASLVRYCLLNHIEPKWLAANDASGALAKRLGFTKGESYYTIAFEGIDL